MKTIKEMIDYTKLASINVKTQSELDAIPMEFKGKIHIKFGDNTPPAIVTKRYLGRVEVRGSFSVSARGNSKVWAYGNSKIHNYTNKRTIQ